MIAILLVLPIGWSKSPPAFCTGTETVVDLANTILATNMPSLLVPHRLDSVSETAKKIPIVTSIPTERILDSIPAHIDYIVVQSLSPLDGQGQVSRSILTQDKITEKSLESPDPVRSSNLNPKLLSSNQTQIPFSNQNLRSENITQQVQPILNPILVTDPNLLLIPNTCAPIPLK